MKDALTSLRNQLSRWMKASGFFSALRRWMHSNSPNRETEPLGLRGEKLAAKYLRRKGYRILEHGHRQRRGEIDLIALHKKCIVFVEVKTWRSGAGGDPSEAVDLRKQRRLTRAALIYLKEKRVLDQPARFDVISIVWPESSEPTIRHFESAFEATGVGQLYG